MIRASYQIFENLIDYIGIGGHWFSGGPAVKRKRHLEDDEDLGSKRFKSSEVMHSTESISPEVVRAPDRNPLGSRAFKILSLAKKKSNEATELKPASWKLAMKENLVEISSDEEDDVIMVSDKRDPLSLMPSVQYRMEDRHLQSQNKQSVNLTQKCRTSRPVSLPLHCSTPASSANGQIPRFIPTSERRLLTSNSGSSSSKMRHCSSNRLGRTSCATSTILSRSKTLTMEVNLHDKNKYSALLQSIMKSRAKPCLSKPFLNLQDAEKNIVESSHRQESATSLQTKPNIEILDLTKPENLRRPVRLKVGSYSKESEDNSDVEIVSVTSVPKPIVPKVNSYESKIKQNKFLSPDWLREIVGSYEKFLKQTTQEAENVQIKKDIYAKQNEKALASIEDRIKRHMTITETVILDEAVEEEPKLPELTPNILKQIQSALSPNPPSAVIAEGFGLRITRKDMHTLANVNWLNDEVINFYMNLLIERGKKEGLPKVYAFNTFFYPKLMESGHSSLRRWTRKIDIFAQDLIIVPVHLDVHWCMSIIDFRKKVVEYYDSMGHANNRCLTALLKYLEDESKDKKNQPYDTSQWKCVNMKDIPQQMNGSDCGMFACTFAEYKCRNAKINFSQKEMPYFRKKMVYEILTGKLML